MPTYYTYIDSPIGPLLLTSDGKSLTRLYMNAHRHTSGGPEPGWIEEKVPILVETERQLGEYFAGARRSFDLPVDLGGSPFQARVWEELKRIDFGETISYGELARRIGDPNASRAVGLANGRNPVSIIVPCHRVIGASGKLTGYGGGLERKATLLAHERATTGLGI